MISPSCIGIVTVTYNSSEVLEPFLRCVWAQTHIDLLLFAVDNNSTDPTLAILTESTDSRLHIIANSENLGIAEGNNQGIKAALAAGCSSVLLLNNDTEFPVELLKLLVQGLADNLYDLVTPKMLIFDDPKRIWAAGGFFQPRLAYRSLHYGENEIDRGQFDTARQVTFTPACCVLIRASVFHEIGFMDSRYFVYSDDTDFMYRALISGMKLGYMPHATLYHKVSSLTGGPSSPFSIRYSARNRAFFMRKHFDPINAYCWILFYRLYYMARYFLRKDSFAKFRIRQLALSEAMRMPVD